MPNTTAEETPMNPLTDAQLDEIAARHKAATPGPWGSHRDLDGVYTIQARPRVTCAGMETDGDIATLAAGRTDAESYANARFIGHAREDVPALLAEVRRLRAQLAATRTKVLATEADEIVAHCPDHGSRDTARISCHCDVADDMRRRAGAAAEETREIVHGCPPDGSGLTPCCGRTPFELPLSDRISSEAPVTCPGAAPVSA